MTFVTSWQFTATALTTDRGWICFDLRPNPRQHWVCNPWGTALPLSVLSECACHGVTLVIWLWPLSTKYICIRYENVIRRDPSVHICEQKVIIAFFFFLLLLGTCHTNNMNYPGLILIVVIMFMAITNTDSRSLPNNLRR